MDTFFPGDEAIVRLRVKEVKGNHVLTECLQEPVREFWFVGSVLERTKQGPLALDAEKRAAAENAPATPVPTPVVSTKKDEAITYVMKAANVDQAAAEKIVEEQGTASILADRDAELAASEKDRANTKSAV